MAHIFLDRLKTLWHRISWQRTHRTFSKQNEWIIMQMFLMHQKAKCHSYSATQDVLLKVVVYPRLWYLTLGEGSHTSRYNRCCEPLHEYDCKRKQQHYKNVRHMVIHDNDTNINVAFSVSPLSMAYGEMKACIVLCQGNINIFFCFSPTIDDMKACKLSITLRKPLPISCVIHFTGTNKYNSSSEQFSTVCDWYKQIYQHLLNSLISTKPVG